MKDTTSKIQKQCDTDSGFPAYSVKYSVKYRYLKAMNYKATQDTRNHTD